MNRKGSAIIATLFVGLFLVLTAVALYYVNVPASSGDSSGDSLLVSRVGGVLDKFTGSSQPPKITQIAGLNGDSGSSSGGSTTTNPSGNNAPVANAGVDQNVNEGVLVALDGSASSDPDSDPLTFSWVQTAGTTVTLSSTTAINPTFTAPQVSSAVTLTFSLIVNDGTVNSNSDTINVFVNDISNPVNFPPFAQSNSLTLDEDSSISFNLICNDPENDALTYSIVSGPSNGVLTGSADTRTYTPNSNFAGSDSFTFKCNDGNSDSNTATISITVNNIEDSPFWTALDDSRDAGVNPADGTIVYSNILAHVDDPDLADDRTSLIYTINYDSTNYGLYLEDNDLKIKNYNGAPNYSQSVSITATDSTGRSAVSSSFILTVHTEVCITLDSCNVY